MSPLLFLLATLPALAEPSLGGQDCPGLKSPSELCAEFEATPSLASDPAVQDLRKSCETFFSAATAGLNIICRYKSDSQIQNYAHQLAERAPDQADSKDLLNAIHDLTIHYYAAALEARQAMDTAFGALKPRLGRLAKTGSSLLKAELRCDGPSGTEGAAPGALQLGLAKQALDHVSEVERNVGDTLNRFLVLCNGNAIAASEQGKEILNTEDHFGVPVASTNEDSEENPLDAASPAAPSAKNGKVVVKDLAGYAVGGLSAKMIGGPATLAAGTALKLAGAKKIDALTLVNTGMGVLVAVVGAPTAVIIGTGIAGDLIEANIRANWARADAKIVLPYLKYLRSVPELDSRQAASGYEKNDLDYCQKCNNADLEAGVCPAKNEYNPRWYDPKVRNGRAFTDWKNR
ncbi:MAG: hypothetical protein ACXWR4_04080 [Bdellovibrionota bacterium]